MNLFFNILLYSLLILSVVFIIGQILYMFYILFTDSSKLSLDDFKKKNYWDKLFKKK